MATSGKKNVTLDRRFGINNDIKGTYAVEVTEFVEDGVKDFITEVIRYENADDLEGTYIGKYSENGTLEIYEGNETEEQYVSKLDREMTRSAVSMIPSQFSDMTQEERIRFNVRTGNRNIDAVPLSNQEILALYGEADDSGDAMDGGGVLPTTTTTNSDVGISTFQQNFNSTINISIEGRNARTTYGQYCYPLDMKDSKQDRIKFTMKYSKGSRVTTSTTNLNDNRVFNRREEIIDGHVILPIQSGITDQNSVKWNGAQLNALQAFGAGAATRIFSAAGGNEPIDDTINEIGNVINDGKRALLESAGGGDVRSAINVYLAQQAVGARNLLSRTTGAIVNPNIEMLFDAPALRPFQFQFRMSPRSKEEAAQVRSIINFFKQGMSVKTSSSNIFLKAPNIFDIRYITYNGNTEVDHPSINRIKTCALLAASVDYTPDNTYMTYDDSGRSMTSYGLTLSFNELDPIYEDDYLKSAADGGLGMTNSTATAERIGF